jgi:jasmonate ZIM domain-containing protein
LKVHLFQWRWNVVIIFIIFNFIYDSLSIQAQAIMLLAGNGGSSGTQNKPISTPQAQAQAPIPGPPVGDIFVGNKINTTAPSSGMPSPISVTSSSTNDLAIVKPVVTLAPSVKHIEPTKPASSVGPTSATLVPAGMTLFASCNALLLTSAFLTIIMFIII